MAIVDDNVEFYRGIICALALVAIYNQSTLYEEIVDSVDRRRLYKVAKKDCSLRWIKWNKYIKSP